MHGPVQEGALWGPTQTILASNRILAWEWLLSKAQRVLLAQGGQGQAVGTQPWLFVSVGVTLGHPICTLKTVAPVGFGRIFFRPYFAFTLTVRWRNVRPSRGLEKP